MLSCQESVEVRVPVPDEVRQDVGGRVLADDAELLSAAPSMFVWRGRLYVVRRVLSRWRERAPWWRSAAQAEETRQPATLTDAEQVVWRVEASAGRELGTATYELAFAPQPPASAQLGSAWTLLRVLD